MRATPFPCPWLAVTEPRFRIDATPNPYMGSRADVLDKHVDTGKTPPKWLLPVLLNTSDDPTTRFLLVQRCTTQSAQSKKKPSDGLRGVGHALLVQPNPEDVVLSHRLLVAVVLLDHTASEHWLEKTCSDSLKSPSQMPSGHGKKGVVDIKGTLFPKKEKRTPLGNWAFLWHMWQVEAPTNRRQEPDLRPAKATAGLEERGGAEHDLLAHLQQVQTHPRSRGCDFGWRLQQEVICENGC